MILCTTITVECDRCKRVEIFAGEKEIERFREEWFQGIVHEFCSDCRVNTASQEQKELQEFLERVF